MLAIATINVCMHIPILPFTVEIFNYLRIYHYVFMYVNMHAGTSFFPAVVFTSVHYSIHRSSNQYILQAVVFFRHMATALNVFSNYAWLPVDQAATSVAEFEANTEVLFLEWTPMLKSPTLQPEINNFTAWCNRQFWSLSQISTFMTNCTK